MPDAKIDQKAETKPENGGTKIPPFLVLVAVVLIGAIAWWWHSRPATSENPAQNPPTQEPPTLLALEHTVLRQRDPLIDSGTCHLYVRNISGGEVRIADILVDGQSVTALEQGEKENIPYLRLQHPTVIWATAFPPRVTPQAVSDIRLRLHSRQHMPEKITILPEGGKPLEVDFARDAVDSLRIEDIAFSEDLTTAYIYASNVGEKVLESPRISFDLAGNAPAPVLAWEKLAPQEKKVAIFRFAHPLKRGSCLNVKIQAENTLALASVRVFSLFPVSTWPHGGYAGDTRAELCFDPTPFCVPTKQPGADPEETPPASPAADDDPNQAIYVYRNTTCRDSNLGQALGQGANICWRRVWECYETDPQRACFGHICMYQKLRSCHVYGEVMDFAAYTPFEVTGFPAHGNRRYSGNPLRNTLYARTAVAGAAPGHAILNQFCRLLPQELQISVMAQVGEGVKGVLYSGSKSIAPNTPLGQSLTRINGMLQALKPYLRVGAPCPMQAQTPNQVRAYTILGGERGIVLIVVNERFANRFPESKGWIEHNGETKPASLELTPGAENTGAHLSLEQMIPSALDEKDREFRADPKPRVKVEFLAPPGVELQRCVDVTTGEPEGEVTFSPCADGTKVGLTIKRLTTVKVYLLGPEAILERDQDNDGAPDLVELFALHTHPAVADRFDEETRGKIAAEKKRLTAKPQKEGEAF